MPPVIESGSLFAHQEVALGLDMLPWPPDVRWNPVGDRLGCSALRSVTSLVLTKRAQAIDFKHVVHSGKTFLGSQ